jgi:hypothetical protein
MQVAEKILEEEAAKILDDSDEGYSFDSGLWWAYYMGRVDAEKADAPALKDVEKIVEKLFDYIGDFCRDEFQAGVAVFTAKVKLIIKLYKIQSRLEQLPDMVELQSSTTQRKLLKNLARWKKEEV